MAAFEEDTEAVVESAISISAEEASAEMTSVECLRHAREELLAARMAAETETAGEIKNTAASSEAHNAQVAEYERLLQRDDGAGGTGMPLVTILQLRTLVMKKGLPRVGGVTDNGIRIRVWKLLLGVSASFNSAAYLAKLETLTDEIDFKIKDDAFRTFKGNENFWARVKEEELVRVLNAIAGDHGYVQGMNVLLGPWLYVAPSELDAYYCFDAFLTNHCPRYIQKNLDGVHSGCALLDRCLQVLDPGLHKHIIGKISDIKIFAFPSIMTLMANMKPFEEALRIWDAIFAFGIHFNIILLAVYLMLRREALLHEKQAYKLKCMLMEPLLDSELLIRGSLLMVKYIPEDLFEQLVMHPIRTDTDDF